MLYFFIYFFILIMQLRIAKDLPDSSLVNSSAKIGSKEEECSDPISLTAGESGIEQTPLGYLLVYI